MRRVGIVFAVIAAGLCGGLGVIVLNTGEDQSALSTVLPEEEAGKVTPQVSPGSSTIREGTWQVGSDVKPGKYKTKGALDSVIPMCYWDVKTGDRITDQGVKNKPNEQGIVTLKKGQVFTTSGCELWFLDEAKPVSWITPAVKPLKDRKVYVVETLPGSWQVASAQAWIDRYTGSNWVMAKTCPASAYRCIFVKPGNLAAPRLAETRGYSSSRVTIIVDLAYANPRVVTAKAKRWVLAHEFGHAAGLREHSSSCSNFMHSTNRCMDWAVTASQKAKMSKR